MNEYKNTTDEPGDNGCNPSMNPTNQVYGPPRKAPEFYIGERFTHRDVERWPNGSPVGKRDKGARRLLRGFAMKRRSRIKVLVFAAQRMRAEANRLADNSHEAKRNLAGLILESQQERAKEREAQRKKMLEAQMEALAKK